jgi:hypothetical protein
MTRGPHTRSLPYHATTVALVVVGLCITYLVGDGVRLAVRDRVVAAIDWVGPTPTVSTGSTMSWWSRVAPCTYADGGVDADGGHVVGPMNSVPVLDRDGGPTGQCWGTRGTVVAYPTVQGLSSLPCQVSIATGVQEQAVIRAMIRARVLPVCAAQTGIPSE